MSSWWGVKMTRKNKMNMSIYFVSHQGDLVSPVGLYFTISLCLAPFMYEGGFGLNNCVTLISYATAHNNALLYLLWCTLLLHLLLCYCCWNDVLAFYESQVVIAPPPIFLNE